MYNCLLTLFQQLYIRFLITWNIYGTFAFFPFTTVCYCHPATAVSYPKTCQQSFLHFFIVFVGRSRAIDYVLNFIFTQKQWCFWLKPRRWMWYQSINALMTETGNGRHQIKDPSSSPCHPTCQLFHLIHWHFLSTRPPPGDHEPKSYGELSDSLFLSLSIRGLACFIASTDLISKSM